MACAEYTERSRGTARVSHPELPGEDRPGWDDLVGETHDVVVIGGGVHGTGTARDAALRGMKVALVERSDWGSGTSSRSSRLFHGGLRYLRSGEFRLVREALRERERHVRLAPGLTRRLGFQVPPTSPGSVPRWQIRVGIALYDALAGRFTSGAWRGTPVYDDVQVLDARLVLALALDARRQGAMVRSYTECLSVERDTEGVVLQVRDRLSGRTGRLRARAVVETTGPWADTLARPATPRLRLTRGSHVVLRGAPADGDARLVFHPRDGRVLFLLPMDEQTSWFGTTDLDAAEPLDRPRTLPEEVAYLGDAFATLFPELGGWEPVGLVCGLRPLVAASGDPSAVSREERILTDPDGRRFTLLGGKLSTYRAVAERLVDGVERLLGRPANGKPTRDTLIPGTGPHEDPATALAAAFSQEDAVTLEDALSRRTGWALAGEVDDARFALALDAWVARFGLEEEARARATEHRVREQTELRDVLGSWTA